MYIPNIESGRIRRPESDHALSIRVRRGDELVATDLNGSVARVRIIHVDKPGGVVEFEVIGPTETRPDTYSSELCIARLDKQYMDKLAEIIPFTCFGRVIVFGGDYSVTGSVNPALIGRMHNIMVRSCEQCHRPWLPSIQVANDLSACIEMVQSPMWVVLDCITEASQATGWHGSGSWSGNTAETVFVGPEGGWSDDERLIFEHHAIPRLSLDSIIYPAWITPLVWSSRIGSLNPV